jgi:hypothetical protein
MFLLGDNFARMSSSKSKSEGSESKPPLESQRGSVGRKSGKSVHAGDAQVSLQSPEALIQRDGYVIAGIAALVHRPDEGIEASVGRAENILKLSKAAAARLHTPREEDEELTFADFAKLVCADKNSSRARAKLKQLFKKEYTEMMLKVLRREHVERVGRDLTPAEEKTAKRQVSELAEKRVELDKRRRYWKKSEVRGWADIYRDHTREKLS